MRPVVRDPLTRRVPSRDESGNLVHSARFVENTAIESCSEQELLCFRLLCGERPAAATRTAERCAVGLRRRPPRGPASLLRPIGADAIVRTFRQCLDQRDERGEPDQKQCRSANDAAQARPFHVLACNEGPTGTSSKGARRGPARRARLRTIYPARAARRGDPAAAPPGTPSPRARWPAPSSRRGEPGRPSGSRCPC